MGLPSPLLTGYNEGTKASVVGEGPGRGEVNLLPFGGVCGVPVETIGGEAGDKPLWLGGSRAKSRPL